MKRVFIPLFILFLIITDFIFAQKTDLPDFCNPEISLEVLSRMDPAELDRVIQSDKYIVINGTISSITEIERSESNLILDLHLVNGKWIGLETVENYSCIVNINGIEWEQNFPKRVPRVIDDEIFVQNSRILVIGKVSSYVMEQGKLKAVVDGEYIRKIQ